MEIISFVPFIVLIMANNTTRKRETTMEKIYGTRAYWKAVFKQERKQKIKKVLTYICAFFLFTMPVWMFLDYIAKGY
jgi:hypothetical protein|nr:MAG TPA: hypothetical protein [Caudoviricetes sp.]